MKKIFFLFILFITTFFLFIKIRGVEVNHSTSSSPAGHVLSALAGPTATPTPELVGLPVSISIPSLGITASVESVGLDAQGRMGIPQNNVDTAWYKYGSKPGEKGSAVVDGHFDTPTGAPAVFYNISKLEPGNTITVTDTNNKSYTFTVTQVVSYPYDKLPMQQIFTENDKARLNLITCDGTWNRTEHNYSNRAVVYAELTP